MPGTHKGRATKDKAKDTIFLQLLAITVGSDDTKSLVKEVCRKLRIPDCDTTRGIKKCHDSFETVHAALDKVYSQTREHSESQEACDYLAAVILVIYSQMAADSILRERVCSETQFLDRAVDLLASPVARELAVHTLGRVSHQQDPLVLQAVARFTPFILDCAEPQLQHVPFVDKTVCILSHAIPCALEASTPDPNVVDALPRVLRFMISVVGSPSASDSLSFSHLILFCQHVAPIFPSLFLSNSDSIDFLVACARSPDICDRICSQRALIEVCEQLANAPENVCQTGPTSRDAFVSLQMYYRDTDSSACKILKGVEDLMVLVNEFQTNPNCSRSKLGQMLAALILRNETIVRTWMQQFEKEAEEMVRVCEEAARNAADETNKLDVIADILHIQILVSGDQTCKASHYAGQALKRHPSVPFFFYILANFRCGGSCSGDDSISCVLYAEKGLQCVDGMTDYMRQELLFLSVSRSHLVVARMTHGLDSDSRMKEVTALIRTAMANADTFNRVAPLDHRDMPLMAALATHLDLITNGHLWTEEKIKTTRKSFTRTCDIARSTSRGFIPSQESYALDKILDRMSNAWKTWGPTVSSQLAKGSPTADADSDVDIIAWFEKINTVSCGHRIFEMNGVTPGTSRYGFGDAQLYTCSCCNTVSVTLKKCAGCQKTRYCNNRCQKAHWKTHREDCKAARIDAEVEKDEVGAEGSADL